MLQSLYSWGKNPQYSSGIFTVTANNKRTVSNSSSVILKSEKSTMKLQTLFPSLITLFRNRKMWRRQGSQLSPDCYTDLFTKRGLFWSHGKDRQHLTKTLWCTSIINETTTKYKALLLLTYLGFFLYKTLNSQLHFSACNNKGSRVFQWQTKHSFRPAVCPANSITISIITALFRDGESLAIWARHQIKTVCIIYTQTNDTLGWLCMQ
jgi:hypothetical protein